MNTRQLNIFSNLLAKGGYDCEMYNGCFDFIKDKSAVTKEEFLNIPFSYKNDIRNHDLKQRSNPLSPTFGIFGSSGTTGNKTYYKFSMNDRAVFDEISSKILKRAGVREGDLGIICAPVLDGVMAHTMMWEYTAVNAGYVNCPIPSPENFMEVLNSAHPTVVSGLPSAMDFSLAPDFVVPEDSSVRLFLSGGNFFSNSKRKILQDKWGLSWYDFLGVSEIFGPIMGECSLKHGLHYDEDLLLVEIIDPETMQPIEEENKIGIMVITPLWNKGSPLVRYWTDDFAYRMTTPCACGEAGERIYVCGRKNDYLSVNDRLIFPRDIEDIMFDESKGRDVYIDLAENGEIMVYVSDLTEEGKRRFEMLFGCPLTFAQRETFENMRKFKPIYFSKEIKAKFNKK